jgi:tRNA(Ile)-lysidine synthase
VLTRFTKHIKNKHLFEKSQKLLLAISGGADSVALAHLLKQAGFNFELAHCNFKLRGDDSDADEKFCIALAKQLSVNIYVERFDTQKYANDRKLSTQMAARELRYNWFEKLIIEKKFDFLITAHHANDTIETVLINLLRGTGIKGLVGIPEKNGKTIRPLLIFTREEINTYIKQNKIKFRVDKSNLEDKYERNFLRLNIIPKLKKLNASIETTFINNSFILKEESEIINDFLTNKKQQLLKKEHDFYFITKSKLKNEKYRSAILYFILNPFGYSSNQVKNILEHLVKDNLVGKNFISKTHRLSIDRVEIIIRAISEKKQTWFKIEDISQLKNNAKLKLERINDVESIPPNYLPKKNELIIDKKQLIFPLLIRPKLSGDKFKPFGMKGFKLVSDFFKDIKMNVFEKESCTLLLNGNGEIIWVIGYRSDERYRVNKLSKTILKLSVVE